MHSAVMSAGVAKTGEPRLIANGAHTHRRSAKFFRLSQLRKLRGCEQVAAVCYRVRSSGIEFLLVRTGSGHWTFPKGSAEPGLTHAQAAALEAFEEAGVHGRMEEASFTRYIRRKGGRTRNSARSGERSVVKEIAIQAHLCEVSRLDPPQERNRNPTWFSADKAKRRLREDRTPDFGEELARVVDRAITRIRRLRSDAITIEAITIKVRPQKDALQKVQFIDRIPTAVGRTKALRTG
jgi:8-oxo-dGTP pyrophosphatase MutT (NUDIX family)